MRGEAASSDMNFASLLKHHYRNAMTFYAQWHSSRYIADEGGIITRAVDSFHVSPENMPS
jgi:hypothetical protein